MDKILNQIPRPLLIALVFILGIAFIVYTNRPHSICDTQIETFSEMQKGYMFPITNKKGVTTGPIYDRAMNACRDGMGSAGACLEYFKILNKVIVDADAVDSKCGELQEEMGAIQKALGEGMKIITLIAWGEELPDKESTKFTGRLEPAEIALFCRLRGAWLRFFERESLENFKTNVIKDLSTKTFVDKDGTRVCNNCEIPPNLLQLWGGRDEVLKHTILNMNCSAYR